jgi:asparaginyl-tRNA synthetase
MAPIHIDEQAGSDVTGNGSLDLPYQTLAFALFAHGADPQLPQTLIRKDSTATYDEPTQSALKKAKKGADGLEKKRKKQKEVAEKEDKEKREEKERREKLLEDSKKIILVEDDTLPKAARVSSFSIVLLSRLTR